jgi:hypothetical protein
MNRHVFAQLDWNRRCLVIGAGAGMVMTLSLLGAFFGSHWVPDFGLAPTEKRTLELLPFVVVGGAAFLVGVVAFAGALALSVWGDRDLPNLPLSRPVKAASHPDRRPVRRRRRKSSPVGSKNSG